MNPWPTRWYLKALAGFWSLPTVVLGFLFCVLPLLAARQIKSRGWKDGAWDLEAVPGSRLSKSSNVWAAFSIAWFVIYLSPSDVEDYTTRTHERVHLRQQLILGLFHWIFYGLFCIVVWFACRSLHAYRANPFELDARRKAGQTIEPVGPEKGNDRWPWW